MNLKNLSRLLNLSPTTVSRALNGYPEVNAETRARVMAAARLHRYRADRRARSLATGRAMAIGHLIPLSRSGDLINPIFGDFVAGASDVYAREGYDMLLSMVPDEQETAGYQGLQARGAVDGVILHGPLVDDPRPALLTGLGLPFVVHGRVSNEPEGYSWVDVDNRRAFQRATEFLISLGHRRMGLINGPADLDFARRRHDGFAQAMQHAGLMVDPALIVSGAMTEAQGWQATRVMLASGAPPTAVLTASVFSAIGARRAIEEAGMSVGREVSIVTYDDDLSYLRNDDAVPPFAATRSSVQEAGRRAASMLIDLIRNPGPPRSDLLTTRLHPGLSAGPAPR